MIPARDDPNLLKLRSDSEKIEQHRLHFHKNQISVFHARRCVCCEYGRPYDIKALFPKFSFMVEIGQIGSWNSTVAHKPSRKFQQSPMVQHQQLLSNKRYTEVKFTAARSPQEQDYPIHRVSPLKLTMRNIDTLSIFVVVAEPVGLRRKKPYYGKAHKGPSLLRRLWHKNTYMCASIRR